MGSPYKPVEDKLKGIEQHHANMESVNNYPQPMTSTAPPAAVHVMQMSGGGMPIFPQPVGPKSMEMTCPNCRCRITTTVRHRSTAKTHIACLLLSWTCCCCCLPYCMDSCRNANHFCPMCGTFIGTYAS